MIEPSLQFFVVRTGNNTFKVAAQDENQILRTKECDGYSVMDVIQRELMALKQVPSLTDLSGS